MDKSKGGCGGTGEERDTPMKNDNIACEHVARFLGHLHYGEKLFGKFNTDYLIVH